MNYLIREATMEDTPLFLDMCVAMIKDVNLPFRTGGTKCVEDFCTNWLRNPNAVCYILLSEGNVIGWIGAEKTFYPFSDEEIVQIGAWDIHPEHRNQGLGGMLLSKVNMWTKGQGCRLLTVGVNIDSSTVPELAFKKLENAGFKEFERTFYIEV